MLEIRNLSINYGGIKAIENVSMSVRQGEMVAIIGANGAGKTTTLHAVSGLLRPREGACVFMGEAISGLGPDAIVARGVVQVPEGRQVFTRLSVDENLRIGAYLIRDKALVRRNREKVLSMFPILGRHGRQPAGTLSGGEQQMLAIGRALMANPRLLLLDEPSMGLSPILTRQLFEALAGLRAQGMTILLVEQNAYDALKISDRAYIMETGSVIMDGASGELIRDERVAKAYLGGFGA